MAAQTADRKVTRLGSGLTKRTVPLAATAKVWSGGLVMLNATGFGTAAAAGTATLVVAGIAESQQDNTTGADGDLEVVVESDVIANFGNLGADPVTQADVGQLVFAADDQTIARTNGGGAGRPAVGYLHELRGTVPYVYIPEPGRRLV